MNCCGVFNRGLSCKMRRGNTVVELLLVLPLLISLGIGVGEYSYYIYAKGVMLDAARTAARVAVESTATNTAVTSAVDTTMATAGFQTVGYTVTTNPPSVVNTATGTDTTVTVSCPWGNFGAHVLPTCLGGIDPAKQINVSITMIRE